MTESYSEVFFVFRPVNIPRGPYNVVVNFSCAVRSVKVITIQ